MWWYATGAREMVPVELSTPGLHQPDPGDVQPDQERSPPSHIKCVKVLSNGQPCGRLQGRTSTPTHVI